MGAKKKFFERDDGWLQCDTASLTFLIGDTLETKRHIGLWVTGIEILDYHLVERLPFEIDPDGVSPNEDEVVKRLQNEARILLVRSRIDGPKKFADFLKEKREDMENEIWWAGQTDRPAVRRPVTVH